MLEVDIRIPAIDPLEPGVLPIEIPRSDLRQFTALRSARRAELLRLPLRPRVRRRKITCVAMALAGLAAIAVRAESRAVEKILTEINEDRLAGGLEALELDPRLVAVAHWRAEQVAASGDPSPSVGLYQRMNQMLFDRRYAAHTWTSSTLLGARPDAVVRRWSGSRPEWWRDSIYGDFEHIGIAVSSPPENLACTIVLAISRRTVEWREAAPLANLEWVRAEILDEVNLIRKEHREAALEPQEILDIAAQHHARDLVRRAYYSHESPEGSTSRDRARAAGYTARGFVAENIAKGQFEPREVVRRWMNSSGHRRNIVRSRARYLGVGVAFGENENGFEVLWVQVFGGK